jgi:hypothetical protein
VSDIDTVVEADGLKALDPKRPIREADVSWAPANVRFARRSGLTFKSSSGRLLTQSRPWREPHRAGSPSCTLRAPRRKYFYTSEDVECQLDLVASDRVYPPETVVAMSTAFDNVCGTVSVKINGNDGLRRQLALIILRHVDEGEHDPLRLAELAFNELAGIERSAA